MKLQVSNSSLNELETHSLCMSENVFLPSLCMIIYLGIKLKIASYFPLALQSYYFAAFLPSIVAAENFAVLVVIIPL